MMLPKIQRSIFHLGEEGGAGDGHRGADAHQLHLHLDAGQSHGRLPERRGRDDAYDHVVVGLQILVQHHRGRHPRPPRHVVLKQMVSWPPARHRSFDLRACSLCRRELIPSKDVYMYRGDQGFCSEECRRQQILTDEAREHEAMVRRDRRGLPHHRHHHHHHGPRPAAAIRGAPRRLLGVA